MSTSNQQQNGNISNVYAYRVVFIFNQSRTYTVYYVHIQIYGHSDVKNGHCVSENKSVSISFA